MLATEVIRKHGGKHGSIAFAVRRPGEWFSITTRNFMNSLQSICLISWSLFIQDEPYAARKARQSQTSRQETTSHWMDLEFSESSRKLELMMQVNCLCRCASRCFTQHYNHNPYVFFLFSPLSGLEEFHSQFFPYPLYKDDE